VDLREAPLIERKAKLAKVLPRASDGIRYLRARSLGANYPPSEGRRHTGRTESARASRNTEDRRPVRGRSLDRPSASAGPRSNRRNETRSPYCLGL
jgi:hypothetical protein